MFERTKRISRVYSALERFEMQHIKIPESGCWIWTGVVARYNGYGFITVNGKQNVPAHRFAYTTFVGEIPEGHKVCHKCDVQSCVNPNHLFTGTQKDNAMDAARKNRLGKAKGERNWRAALTAEEVRKIRKSTGTAKEIATAFGVTSSCVRHILNRRSWRWLED